MNSINWSWQIRELKVLALIIFQQSKFEIRKGEIIELSTDEQWRFSSRNQDDVLKNLTTFKLTLEDNEKESRSRLYLPYFEYVNDFVYLTRKDLDAWFFLKYDTLDNYNIFLIYLVLKRSLLTIPKTMTILTMKMMKKFEREWNNGLIDNLLSYFCLLIHYYASKMMDLF